MAWALVTSAKAFSTTGNGFTSGSVDTTGANFIIIVLAAAVTGSTVSDSKGNTWNALTEWVGGFGDRFIHFFYAENATVGSGHTFTVTGTGTFPSIIIGAFSGGATSSSFDVENGPGSQILANFNATGSITPSVNNELLIASVTMDAAEVPSVDSGFTVLETIDDTSFGHAAQQAAYIIETTATAKNPTFTWVTTTRTTAAIASFKSAAAAATFVPFARTQIIHGDWDA